MVRSPRLLNLPLAPGKGRKTSSYSMTCSNSPRGPMSWKSKNRPLPTRQPRQRRVGRGCHVQMCLPGPLPHGEGFNGSKGLSMADAREIFYPVEIQRDYQGMMRILWDDGHECLYPYSALRKACPCATCRELRGQQHQAPANPFQVVTAVTTQDVHPVRLSAVGNYALHIDWSDGHRTGIYPWDM